MCSHFVGACYPTISLLLFTVNILVSEYWPLRQRNLECSFCVLNVVFWPLMLLRGTWEFVCRCLSVSHSLCLKQERYGLGSWELGACGKRDLQSEWFHWDRCDYHFKEEKQVNGHCWPVLGEEELFRRILISPTDIGAPRGPWTLVMKKRM